MKTHMSYVISYHMQRPSKLLLARQLFETNVQHRTQMQINSRGHPKISRDFSHVWAK